MVQISFCCLGKKTVSHLSQLLKFFLKIAQKLIFKLYKEQMSQTDLEFHNGLGARKAQFEIEFCFNIAEMLISTFTHLF